MTDNPYPPRIVERLKEKTGKPDANGCMRFLGALSSTNHGVMHIGWGGITTRSASRVALEIKVRQRLPRRTITRHTCPNSWCVNPDHLEPGTHKENNGPDRIRDGTYGYRLKEEQARLILRSTAPAKFWARHYGVSLTAVYDIRRGKAWKHLQTA